MKTICELWGFPVKSLYYLYLFYLKEKLNVFQLTIGKVSRKSKVAHTAGI